MKATTCFMMGLVAVSFGASASAVRAGPHTDDLSKCIIESTTTDDRAALVRWMFAAASLHPAVKSIASVSEEQLSEATRKTGELLMKLLTESCKQPAEKAIKYEGSEALPGSLSMLGQLAGKELFSSPEVSGGMASLEKYFDAAKVKAVLDIK